jgi:[ribosomal protein S5]-alanine N-acetyltransferase
VTLEIEDEVARNGLIRLRRKRREDADADYQWRCDPELARYDAATPLRASLSDFLLTYEEDLRFPSPFRRVFAIESLDGQHIGNVMYYNIDERRGEAELGITIGERQYWSQGYGRDAVSAFVRFIFSSSSLHRIYLNTLDWNVRAQRSFLAAGFTQCGIIKRGLHSFVSMEIRREDVLGGVRLPVRNVGS